MTCQGMERCRRCKKFMEVYVPDHIKKDYNSENFDPTSYKEIKDVLDNMQNDRIYYNVIIPKFIKNTVKKENTFKEKNTSMKCSDSTDHPDSAKFIYVKKNTEVEIRGNKIKFTPVDRASDSTRCMCYFQHDDGGYSTHSILNSWHRECKPSRNSIGGLSCGGSCGNGGTCRASVTEK